MLEDLAQKLVLSIGDDKIEIDFDDLSSNLFIPEAKPASAATENIQILSTSGKDKIDFSRETTAVNPAVITGRSEEAAKSKEAANQDDEFFTNRKQRLSTRTVAYGSQAQEAHQVTHNTDKMHHETETNDKQPSKANPALSLGLSAIYERIETGKVEEFVKNKNVDKALKCRDYCRDFLNPVFMDIRQELINHGREANIHVDLTLLLLAQEVRYQGRVEYDYIAQIKNASENPSLQIKTSTVNGGLAIRNNLINKGIDDILASDIFKDFLDSYQHHLYARRYFK